MQLNSDKITTTSEYGGSGPYGSIKNLNDNDPTSEWIINKADTDTYVSVTIELPKAVRVHSCELSPRRGKQKRYLSAKFAQHRHSDTSMVSFW